MHISLTPQLEQWVCEKVESGLYRNGSEVICEALRLMQARDKIRQHKLRYLRDKLAEGAADLSAGRSEDFSNEDEIRALFARL